MRYGLRCRQILRVMVGERLRLFQMRGSSFVLAAARRSQLPLSFRSADIKDHWTDALALWQEQPPALREVIVASVSAKLSLVPAALGLVDTPRRFVYLPSAAGLLSSAVADVARDANIIWMFRSTFLGEENE